jgi:hypothetical protein
VTTRPPGLNACSRCNVPCSPAMTLALQTRDLTPNVPLWFGPAGSCGLAADRHKRARHASCTTPSNPRSVQTSVLTVLGVPGSMGFGRGEWLPSRPEIQFIQTADNVPTDLVRFLTPSQLA